MKYSIELGPVECKTGSVYEYELSDAEESALRLAVMIWYRTLRQERKQRYVKAVDVYPEFVRHSTQATFPSKYITICVTVTAGILEKPPKGITIPDGRATGWELSFYHRCPSDHLEDYLKQFPKVADDELRSVLETFKSIKPRIAA